MPRRSPTTIIIQALRGEVADAKRDLAVATTEILRDDTPKDTGWAAANWIPRIGAPDATPKGDNRSGSVTRARAEQQAAIETLNRVKFIKGQIFISNNVPYIPLLNAGSSQQAPSAFIQRAFSKAIAATSRSSGTTVRART